MGQYRETVAAKKDEERDEESADEKPSRLVERGQAIRAARRLRGYETQGELAEASGVPQAQISRYESGARDMFMATALRLAQTLNLSVDQLLGMVPLPAPSRDEAEIERDPYPNRRRLRRLPEYAAAPPWVKEIIQGRLRPKGDMTFFEWVDELRVLLAMHARGESLESPCEVAGTKKTDARHGAKAKNPRR